MSKINNVIIHCSDSSFGNVLTIDKWHKERGWKGIGYNLVITNGYVTKDTYYAFLDGQVETGRPFDDDGYLTGSEVGAHALGYNDSSIGICLIGKGSDIKYGKGAFTPLQMQSLIDVIVELVTFFPNLTTSNILGHYQVSTTPKTCPNLGGNYTIENIRKHVQRILDIKEKL